MKKEDWVNSILESTSGIEAVEANPFLFHKITNRIHQRETGSNLFTKYNIGWAVTILIAIALNVSSLVIYQTKIHNQNESASIEALANEMVSTTNYNY